MTMSVSLCRTQIVIAPVIVLLSAVTAAQTTKRLTYTVGPRANISITNHYGSITVKPSGTRQFIVTTKSYSDGVSFLNEQRGKRIELRTESSRVGTGLADYTVLCRVMLSSPCDHRTVSCAHRGCAAMSFWSPRPVRSKQPISVMPISTLKLSAGLCCWQIFGVVISTSDRSKGTSTSAM
jgi:hypothetical protein